MGVRLYSMREQYLHVLDVTDPWVLSMEAAQLRGEDPVLLRAGLPDAASTMVEGLLARVRAGKRPIGTLSIHGHGLPGIQSLAGGIPRPVREVDADWVLASLSPHARDVLANRNLDAVRPALARLRGHFSSNGRVRLMGCYVGRGPEGRRLLRALARLWQVPVFAGSEIQEAGGVATFFLEGPTVVEFP